MQRAKLIDIELSRPLEDLANLENYSSLRGLVRLHGVPLGDVQLSITNGCCPASDLAQAILPYYNWTIARQLVQQRLAHPTAQSWEIRDLLDQVPSVADTVCPSVTVAMYLHQTSDLSALEALQGLDYDNLEILIVEAQPQSELVANWVKQQPAPFRYLSMPQPGLNAARNLVIQQAHSEIIAFTDGRATVDADWVKALAATFVDLPEVAVVTGLVMPATLETAAQAVFEAGYGLGRGYEQRCHQLDPTQPIPWAMLGTMQIGSGVNMAFRRAVFDQIGDFNLAFDQVQGEGGDWEMFCRLLLAGETILYEPRAIVRCRAPEQMQPLQMQVARSMSALYTYIAIGIQSYPDQWLNFLQLGLWQLVSLIRGYLGSGAVPRAVRLAELRGIWQGVWQGWQSRQADPQSRQDPAFRTEIKVESKAGAIAVCTVDLAQPLVDLDDVANYSAVRVFVSVKHLPVGCVDVWSHYRPVSAARLRSAIAQQLYVDLLALTHNYDHHATWAQLQSVFAERWQPSVPSSLAQLPPALAADISVSIIITTCDRPVDLANCLRHLQVQQTQRPVEIIVADNRPASGLTPPVVAQFPGVKLVSEPRPGGSYGRNAAIAASTGEIVVSVDDDVIVPPDWLEKLIAPLARPEVMVVTGNVLPFELETPAQRMFETLKGGLGAGFKPFEVDHNWWASFSQSPPTWDLGVSANAAFRATIFSHPQIGLLDEVLGPGTPTAGGEENHLIYKVLRAGYKLAYEPAAYVWHRHRRDLPALYRQVYGHMKGGTAYHLLLWLQEGDKRGLWQLVYELPCYYTQHLLARLKGQHQTPWSLLWSEVAGYFAGYWGYWRSRQLVQRQGRSAAYVPVAQRSGVVSPEFLSESLSQPLVGPIVEPMIESPIAEPESAAVGTALASQSQ